jgi:hypothetical protein
MKIKMSDRAKNALTEAIIKRGGWEIDRLILSADAKYNSSWKTDVLVFSDEQFHAYWKDDPLRGFKRLYVEIYHSARKKDLYSYEWSNIVESRQQSLYNGHYNHEDVPNISIDEVKNCIVIELTPFTTKEFINKIWGRKIKPLQRKLEGYRENYRVRDYFFDGLDAIELRNKGYSYREIRKILKKYKYDHQLSTLIRDTKRLLKR